MIAPEDFSADMARSFPVPPERLAEPRPEMVAHGRELAADESYPSHETLRHVSRQIIASPEWNANAS